MEVGGVERLIDQFSVDDAQVSYENGQMTMGQQVMLNEFDNDQAHIDGHEAFQKGAKYRQLDPQLQALIQAHVDAHKQRVLQKQQNDMQAQMMMQMQQAQGQAQATAVGQSAVPQNSSGKQ